MTGLTILLTAIPPAIAIVVEGLSARQLVTVTGMTKFERIWRAGKNQVQSRPRVACKWQSYCWKYFMAGYGAEFPTYIGTYIVTPVIEFAFFQGSALSGFGIGCKQSDARMRKYKRTTTTFQQRVWSHGRSRRSPRPEFVVIDTATRYSPSMRPSKWETIRRLSHAQNSLPQNPPMDAGAGEAAAESQRSSQC